jgi:hypothetical protein
VHVFKKLSRVPGRENGCCNHELLAHSAVWFETSVHRHEVFVASPTQHAASFPGIPTLKRIGRTVVVEQEITVRDSPL